ncbi:MAG: fasciclin domain-containing protein [Idiomarina sp.]|nr:fasciclin domain-containing protein [Idiomarina sp.]
MQTTSTSNSTRKSALIAIAISFALGTSGYALAQEYEMPEPPEEEQQEQEEREVSREELLEQQAREALDENRPTDYSNHSLDEMLSSEAYFGRFHQALEQTGILDDLDPEQEYTVFAPFDEALNRLPEGVWDNWIEGNDSDEFHDFIAYHIVEGAYAASDLDENAQRITTLNGEDLELRSAYGAIMVDHVSVNMPDIQTNQGYVHGIDSVLGDAAQFYSQPDDNNG